jgi:hypothetical protein
LISAFILSLLHVPERTWAFERYCGWLAVPTYLTAMNKLVKVLDFDVPGHVLKPVMNKDNVKRC